MADDRTTAQRSETMRRVKSRGTSCEAALARAMRGLGLRPGRTGGPRSTLPGSPDFVFRRARIAVFVDGCFWHGCAKHCRMPGTNRAYWERKIARNKARDRAADRALRGAGWRVVRVWEHAVRVDAQRCARRVLRAVQTPGT